LKKKSIRASEAQSQPAAGFGSFSETSYTVPLERYTYGGDTLGRLPDGRAVFVPYAIPGEVVRLRLIEERPHYARARLEEVLEPSPQRITPRCPHFTVCGGCHYQHIPYPAQLQAKNEIVQEQLLRVANLSGVQVNPPIASSLEWSYRNHVQFHLCCESETQGCRLGFVAAEYTRAQNSPKNAATPDQIVALQECYLPDDLISQVWQQIDLEPVAGLQRVALRSGVDDDLLLVLESDSPETPEFSVDFPLSAVHLSPAGALLLAGSDHIITRVKQRLFRVSASSFFQVNTLIAEKMVDHLLAHLPLTRSSTVLDLYCGAGLFSAFLAPHVAKVIGVEISPFACVDYEVNLDEFDNVSLYEAAAEEVLAHVSLLPDVVIVDPPRAGLTRPVLQSLLRLQPYTIAYVSCDPATMARDLRYFSEGGYQILSITPFDLFPQTYHVECVVLMARVGKG